MTSHQRQRVLSMTAVAVGAMTLGVVLAGGLGLTPRTQAEVKPSAPASAPVPMVAPASLPDFATLSERVTPSVVAVYTEDVVKPQDMRRFHREMDPFEFFFGPNRLGPEGTRPQKRRGAGSGFFIRADGLIVTNNHVVEGAEKINVRLADGTELPAKVVGRDAATDVALIKIDGKGHYAPLLLGDSDALRVGEWVMAVGNPLAMEHTVTVGVVSAKGRTLNISPDPNSRSFENFIQTDAAINLGNSGGPLVSLRGEAIGMNTAINASGQNLGFAVPANTIKMVLPQLEDKGRVVRGYLNVTVKNVDQTIQQAFGLPSRDGAFVENVKKGGPGDKAGLKDGDTLVAVNGTAVKETRQLIERVSAVAPGQKVELEVVRDGKRQTLTAVVAERPSSEGEKETTTAKEDTPSSKLGLVVAELSPRIRRQFDIPREVDQGVVITDVTDLSPADDRQLRPGDVILRVNGQDVASEADFRDAVASVQSGSLVKLYVYQTQLDQKGYVILTMP